MRRIFALALLFAILGCASAPQKIKEDASVVGADLRLTASVRVGFAPLDVLLTAELTGVTEDDIRYCHPRESWRQKCADDEIILESAPACLHSTDNVRINTVFYKTLTLTTPGECKIYLVIFPKDGAKPITSNIVKIEVIESEPEY